MITTVKSTSEANGLLWDVLLPLALCYLQRNTGLEQTEEQESIITRQALSRECLFPEVIYSIAFRFASLFQVMLFQCLFPKNKYSMKSLLMDACRQSLTPGHRNSWQTYTQAIMTYITNLSTHRSTISMSPVLPTAGVRDPGELCEDVPAVCLGTPSSGNQGWAATYKWWCLPTLCRG